MKSGQNRSSAVMQQRQEAMDSLDDFPTPPWATRALIEHALVRRLGLKPGELTALEPCCNRGYMAKPMAERFAAVYATDVHDYGWAGQQQVADFLFPTYDPRPPEPEDDFVIPAWLRRDSNRPVALTIANPPFRLAQQFIAKALEISSVGCAMLVRTAFLEGEDRYDDLFSVNPPTVIAQFAERVVMHKGILRDPGVLYWNPDGKDPKTGKKTGAWQKPSSATAYCWVIWIHGAAPQPFLWIPPCRRQMERPGDYPELAKPSEAP